MLKTVKALKTEWIIKYQHHVSSMYAIMSPSTWKLYSVVQLLSKNKAPV